MLITLRQALVAAVVCGLTAAAAGADDPPPAKQPPMRDPVYLDLTAAARKVFEDTFPNHRCIRLVTRGEGEAAVYRATVFDLTDQSAVHAIKANKEVVTTPVLYDLEVDAKGKVLEETRRPIAPGQVPKAVVAAYEKWNPKIRRLATDWSTQVPRGKDRVYHVYVLVNQIEAYSASFKGDGTVLKADPTDKPILIPPE
jgi:hypothetical protein